MKIRIETEMLRGSSSKSATCFVVFDNSILSSILPQKFAIALLLAKHRSTFNALALFDIAIAVNIKLIIDTLCFANSEVGF